MKVAIYARVSTSKQENNQTIASQLEQLKGYVETEGLVLDENHIFIDEGYSGSHLERPGLDGLRDGALMAEFRQVVICSPDRLARRYAYQVVVTEELEQAGCKVIYLQEPLYEDPERRLMQQVQGVIAEYERTKILERTRRGMLHKARQGQLPSWSTPPYGYRYHPKSPRQPSYVTINEEEAAVVKQIFFWCVEEDRSTAKIAIQLNQQGLLPRRKGKGWAPSTIRGMLRNETYIGKAYYNRRGNTRPEKPRVEGSLRKKNKSSKRTRPQEEWIEIPVPAIIDEDTFQRAGNRLKQRQCQAPRNNKRHQYLLRCLVRCGECGYIMTGQKRNKYAYYRCRRGRDLITSHRETKCTNRAARQDLLDKTVWRAIKHMLDHPELIIEQYTRQKAIFIREETQQPIHKLTQHINRYEIQIQRLIDAYQNEVISLSALQSRKRVLEEKIAQFQKEIQELHQAEKKKENTLQIFQNIQSFCESVKQELNQANFNTKRKIIELVIEEVILTHGKVEIKHIIPLQKKGYLRFNQPTDLGALPCTGSPPARSSHTPEGLDFSSAARKEHHQVT